MKELPCPKWILKGSTSRPCIACTQSAHSSGLWDNCNRVQCGVFELNKEGCLNAWIGCQLNCLYAHATTQPPFDGIAPSETDYYTYISSNKAINNNNRGVIRDSFSSGCLIRWIEWEMRTGNGLFFRSFDEKWIRVDELAANPIQNFLFHKHKKLLLGYLSSKFRLEKIEIVVVAGH